MIEIDKCIYCDGDGYTIQPIAIPIFNENTVSLRIEEHNINCELCNGTGIKREN